MLKLLTSGLLFFKTSTIFYTTSPFTQRATLRCKTKVCANSESYDLKSPQIFQHWILYCMQRRKCFMLICDSFICVPWEKATHGN